MAASTSMGSGWVSRRSRRRRATVMADINVTPMVDVMLVLLIVFMVAAPLLTVGVPIDLPQTQAKSMEQDKEPLTLSVNDKGQVFLQNTEIKLDEIVPKLKAIAKNGAEERIYVRGDRKSRLRHGDEGHGPALGRRLSPRRAGDRVRAGELSACVLGSPFRVLRTPSCSAGGSSCLP